MSQFVVFLRIGLQFDRMEKNQDGYKPPRATEQDKKKYKEDAGRFASSLVEGLKDPDGNFFLFFGGAYGNVEWHRLLLGQLALLCSPPTISAIRHGGIKLASLLIRFTSSWHIWHKSIKMFSK